MSAESVINNPPKEFTEPCEACGVSEFQLGVKHAEQRIIKLLEERVLTHPEPSHYDLLHNQLVNALIAVIKGENK